VSATGHDVERGGEGTDQGLLAFGIRRQSLGRHRARGSLMFAANEKKENNGVERRVRYLGGN